MFGRAAELLCSLPASKRLPEPPAMLPFTSTPARSRSPRPSFSFAVQTPAPAGTTDTAYQFQARHPDAPPLQGLSPEVLQQEAEWEAQDTDHLAMAKTFMEAKEFIRAIHWLTTCRSSKAKFMRVYSQYLVNSLSLRHVCAMTEPADRRARSRPSENGTSSKVSPCGTQTLLRG